MTAIEQTAVADKRPSIAVTDCRNEERLAPVLALAREQGRDYSDARRISDEMVELLRSAGIYRALAPRHYGGDELSPAEFLGVIEQIAAADGSTGWVASFGCSPVYFTALPEATLAHIYADGPDVIFAGAIHPPIPVRPTTTGYHTSGRWGWCSGISGADYVGVGIKPTDSIDEPPRVGVFPTDKVEIGDQWNPIGLRGTGSYDVEIRNVTVPRDWTFVRGSAPVLDTPLYRYPGFAMLAQALAVVGLGCARGAIDEFIALAGSHASITGGPSIANRPSAQLAVARAEAHLTGARALFYDAINEAFEIVATGNTLSLAQRGRLRLAATHAAHTGAEITRTIFEAAGSAAVFEQSPLARHFLDAAIVPRHAMLSEATYQMAGGVTLGLPENAVPGFP